MNAATLKHPNYVYEYYNDFGVPPLEDLSCCALRIREPQELPVPTPQDDSSSESDNEEALMIPCTAIIDMDTEEAQCLESPWSIHDFVKENTESAFISCIEKLDHEQLQLLVNRVYTKVLTLYRAQKQKQGSKRWPFLYSQMNRFVLSDSYIKSFTGLFQNDRLNEQQNKFATKVAFFLLEKEIHREATAIVDRQGADLTTRSAQGETGESSVSAAAKSKVRYVAGACVHKISRRIQESVIRNLSKSDKKSKLVRKFEYRKHQMIKQFRVSEAEVDVNDESMLEIEYRQGTSRGLYIVNENVFSFF